MHQHLQLLRPGWPWWTLIFAPYLILTITSELWPSRQDWKGARWFVIDASIFLALALITLWYTGHLLPMVPVVQLIASRIDFALLVLLALDLFFILIAEAIVRIVRHRFYTYTTKVVMTRWQQKFPLSIMIFIPDIWILKEIQGGTEPHDSNDPWTHANHHPST